MGNLLNFFEVFILRDILAFILPGGISLAGIYMIMNASGVEKLEKNSPFLPNLDSPSQIILFLLLSFLIGHVWDAVYRKGFQTYITFQRTDIIKKMLIGNPVAESNAEDDHTARQIRLSVGQFINIKEWKRESAKKWVEASSEKAHELSVLLSYWIEEEDPKIYSDEIARPHIQSHFLHVCGMAFCFFGVCVLLGEIIWKPELVFVKVSLPMWVLLLSAILFGLALILQGQRKREILIAFGIVGMCALLGEIIWKPELAFVKDSLLMWILLLSAILFGLVLILQVLYKHKILMAFCILGACVLLGEIIWKPELVFVKASLPMWILVLFTILFGYALILQGQHKRKILVEHVFYVFYVIWQKRVLAHKDDLEIAQHGGNPNKKKQSKKVNS